MKLSELGFDSWFEAHAGDMLQTGHEIARVTAIDRGACVIRNERGEVPAEFGGRLRYSADSGADLPCVGDWVCAQFDGSGGTAMVHKVFPRKTALRRKCAGKTVKFQMIAANIDVAFIVQSCHYDFNVRRLDRYLVMATEGRIEPVIVLSKTDLIAPEELEALIGRIQQAGISVKVIPLSGVTGCGVDAFRRLLVPAKTYCLIGSSGVGKTTLVNHLVGSETFDTKPVSGTGEGTHATARRQLIVLEQGSMVMDMPGMRELGILGADDGIKESFSDIRDLSPSCRFSDCSHAQEPGCAVLAAVESGEVSEERYQSYMKLKKESDFNDMTLLDKRRKDRAFGKFIKSVQKKRRS